MQPEHTPDEQQIRRFQNLHKVTPLSKYLAMALFVALPFLGGWIGYTHAPEKVVEVERIVETNSPKETPNSEVRETLLATTTVDMVSYRVQYSPDAVELLRGPEVVQTIPWDTSYRSFYTDDDSLLITNWDINFDGYLDLGILSNVGYGGVNRFYHFYTFDPETYSLVQMDDFDTFESDVSNLVNPDLDIESKTITSEMKSGPDWIQKQYFFRDGAYISDDALINRYGIQKDSESCRVDSDCVLVQPDCEDCEFAAINADELDAFRVEKGNRCEANPPTIMCDIVFNGEVKCIDYVCRVTQ